MESNTININTINFVISLASAAVSFLLQIVALTVFLMRLEGKLLLVSHRTSVNEADIEEHGKEIEERKEVCLSNHPTKRRRV